MPIYDYLCSNCGERTEVIHGISDPGPRFCPVCGKEGTLRKAFAPPAVHFKGSGWAKKDRSTGSAKSRAKPESGSDSNAATSGNATDSSSSGSSSGAGSSTGSTSDSSSSSGGSSASSGSSAGKKD